MAEETDQIELELETDVDTEVSVEDTGSDTETEVSASSDDQFDKSNTATQKRIDIILEKISKSGYENLSKDDKEFLFKVGKK